MIHWRVALMGLPFKKTPRLVSGGQGDCSGGQLAALAININLYMKVDFTSWLQALLGLNVSLKSPY